MKHAIKSLLSKEVSVLERSVPLALIFLVAFAGVGAGALVTTFGSTSGEVTINQKAVTITEDQFDWPDFNAAPETVVSQTSVQNNNDDEEVTYQLSADQSGPNTEDVEDWATTVFAIGDGQTYTNTNLDVEVSYDASSDEVQFTVPAVNDYSSNNGVVFGFDTDNDGVYDFQVDTVSSGYQPDYYEYEDGDWTADTYDFNSESNGGDGTSEYEGVFFTDSGTLLEDKSSFTLTVDAERLGSEFAFNVDQDSGDFTKQGDGADASNAVQATPAEEVATISAGDSSGSAVLTVDGGETTDFAVIDEFGSQTPAGDYTLTVEAAPQ